MRNEPRVALLVNALQLVDSLPLAVQAAYEEAICDEDLDLSLELLADLPDCYSRVSELLLFYPQELEVLDGYVDVDTVYGVVNATPDDYYLGGVGAEIVRWRTIEELDDDDQDDEG